MTDVLFDYIKTCRDTGLADIEIARNLLEVGWSKSEINKALGKDFDIELPPPPPPSLSYLQRKKFDFTQPGVKKRFRNIFPVIKAGDRGYKIWRAFEMVQKTALVVLIVLAAGYGFYRLLMVRNSEFEFDQNMDQVRIENFTILKDKVATKYNADRKLPDRLDQIDVSVEFSTDPGTGQLYDYKKITDSSFQFCTVFNLDGESYKKGYTCFPYELNTLGVPSAGLPYNPALENSADILADQKKEFPGCHDPQPLLANNQRCPDPQNCRKPMFTQQFGMSSVALSNSKDRIAQTFKLPKELKSGEVTEISPWFITFSGSSACMAIYKLSDETDPLSGTELAEYRIDIANLTKEAFNPLYIEPIALEAGKTYSMVFSLPDNDSFLSFARGMENADYYDGNSLYLKRLITECTKNCEPELWVDRQDDIKFGIKFY